MMVSQTGAGNGLVLLGNKQQSEPLLSQICVAIGQNVYTQLRNRTWLHKKTSKFCIHVLYHHCLLSPLDTIYHPAGHCRNYKTGALWFNQSTGIHLKHILYNLQWLKWSKWSGTGIVVPAMGLLPDTQTEIAGCTCAGNAGNVFPVTAG